MKKNLILIATLVSILSLLFTTTAASADGLAAPANVKGYATLMVMRFVYGKGYTFVFKLSGPLKQNDLVGYVDISDQHFPLHCLLKERSGPNTSRRAACTASIPQKFVGRKAFVVLVTSGTHIVIPPRNTNHCTEIYTWNHDANDWENFASYCTDAQLMVGDAIKVFTPSWNQTFTYIYQKSAPCDDDEGRGFYFGITFGNYYSILCPPF